MGTTLALSRSQRYVRSTNGLDFRLLGPLQVAVDGEAVPLGGAKQRAVLALLVLQANEVVPADQLIDALWGEMPPDSAANMLHGYVSHLRKLLEPGHRRGEHELLVSRPPGYALVIPAEQIDANRFFALAARARDAAGDAAARARLLREALALWRGPALADLMYESFAAGESVRLEEARLAALEDRIDADLELGRHATLVAELQELVTEHPLHERFRAQLMTALYRCGRQAEALETYREARALLNDELGLEPGPALREVERAVLQHDGALGVPMITHARVRGPRRRSAIAAALLVVGAGAVAASFAATRHNPPANRQPVLVYPHSVAVIDPQRNATVADIRVGGYPGPLAADQTYVYVCNIGDATLSRIAPGDLKVVDASSFSRATDLIADRGTLWAADGGAPGHTPLGVGPGTILHYLPGPRWQTLRVGPAADGPEEQTTLADGRRGYSIWVGNEDSRVVKELDAAFGTTLLTIRGIAPGGLAAVSVGDDQIVWATDPKRNEVVRIEEAAKRITQRIHVPGGPRRIAADAASVWVVTTAPRALWHIDPRTNRVVAHLPLPIEPQRVALGAGSVWVSGFRSSNHITTANDGEVVRVDPRTNRIIARIRLGDVAADGILVSHGLVWVAVPPSA
ncbi:MAG TPA: BTAD domain-containing putative transcriptional regulator [Gaiellaceae bacterium]